MKSAEAVNREEKLRKENTVKLDKLKEELMKTRNGRVTLAMVELKKVSLKPASTKTWIHKNDKAIYVSTQEITILAGRSSLSETDVASVMILKSILEMTNEEKIPMAPNLRIAYHQGMVAEATKMLPDQKNLLKILMYTILLFKDRFPNNALVSRL